MQTALKKEIVANISTHVGQKCGRKYPYYAIMWFTCTLKRLYKQI